MVRWAIALASGRPGENAVAAGAIERRVDAAGNSPRRMNAFLGQGLDHLLTKLAQRDAILSERRMILDHADDVAPRRIGVEAEQHVRRGEMEKAQRMRLGDLAAMQQFAQLRRGRRDAHAHDGVAGFDRGQEMADRANAADARRDRRHFVKGPALGEFLEAANLRDVERRLGDLAFVVKMNRDLGVAFDARDGVDDDGPHDGLLSQTALSTSGQGCGRPEAQ